LIRLSLYGNRWFDEIIRQQIAFTVKKLQMAGKVSIEVYGDMQTVFSFAYYDFIDQDTKVRVADGTFLHDFIDYINGM